LTTEATEDPEERETPLVRAFFGELCYLSGKIRFCIKESLSLIRGPAHLRDRG